MFATIVLSSFSSSFSLYSFISRLNIDVSNTLRCPIKGSEKVSSSFVKCKSLGFFFFTGSERFGFSSGFSGFGYLQDLKNAFLQDLKLILTIRKIW